MPKKIVIKKNKKITVVANKSEDNQQNNQIEKKNKKTTTVVNKSQDNQNNITILNNKSPLRYPGGKSKACLIIENELQKYTNISKYNTLVSPFFGGGSFEFHMQNKYKLNIIANDKFKPLYTFWNMLKNKKQELCDSIIKLKPVSKEQFTTYRNTIMNLTDELKQASYYFVINRCSFSGSTLSGGFSEQASIKRFTDNSIKLLSNSNLEKITFENKDCIAFIENNNKETNLMFLDPPYYLEKSTLYGYNGDMHEKFDHEKLAATLKNIKNWILCYNNCPTIRNLYNDYKIVSVNWNYGMNKSKKSSEILILNFD